MLKKYFAYISSTQDDLRAERRELIRVVTEMGIIPVTMDTFNISCEEDRRLIQKAIEECDYFINLTAHKGGETVGKSFALEVEYAIALKSKIPVFALIIAEKARWKDSKKEKEAGAKKALQAFKKRLESHAHDTWMNLGDLKVKALALISKEINLNPRRGWVPSSEAAAPYVANELSRLLRENELLKSQMALEGKDIDEKVHDHIKHTLKVLATNRISLSFYYAEGENWENTRVFRHLRLFKLLAPELSTPKTAADLSHFLGNILNPDLEKALRKEYPTPSNTIKKIMTDFTLLKLVKVLGTGDGEAWEMTEFGKEAFSTFRLRQMNHPRLKSSPEKKLDKIPKFV